MIRVYEWIGIPRNVIRLIQELMSKRKTRLEIWNSSEKMTIRWIQILRGFSQGDCTRRSAYYYNTAGDTEWETGQPCR